MADAFSPEVPQPLPFVVTWSADEIAELKQRIWSDQTINIIAKCMGRSDGSVRNKCYELKLKLPIAFWTDARRTRLAELVTERLSASQIAAELGTTRNAIIGIVHRMGLQLLSGLKNGQPRKPRHPGWYPPRRRPPRKAGSQSIEPIAEETIELPPDESPFKCSFADLKEHSCRWPISHPGAPDFGFCGADKFKGHSYCARHCRIGYAVARTHPVKGGFRLQEWAA